MSDFKNIRDMRNLGEQERLNSVKKYLDLDVERKLQSIVKLAAAITGSPISLITLIDENEQIILASQGMELDSMPREESFCNQTIQRHEVLVVEDTVKDERFKSFSIVTGPPFVRFYAGVNLNSNDGHHIGTLCLYDVKHKHFSEEQRGYLKMLASQVDDILELNRQVKLSRQKNRALAKAAWFHTHKFRGPLSSILGLVNIIKNDGETYDYDKECIRMLDKAANQLDFEILKAVNATLV